MDNRGSTLAWMRPRPPFSSAAAYKIINEHHRRVEWARNVWGRLTQPRHSFVAWLAMQERLITKDRLLKIGIGADQGCVLCGLMDENTSHLFFSCTFLSVVWNEMSQFMLLYPSSD
eukprot:TRINITY_DN19815_c0_g4_i1.p1 TRINITY_DN19815_c0_g4~~TRINITY_DN19815_c0_g4_i1.p1  ORF type:complete len:116 (+),score=12.48 TRINITY_DN19815_c0_g4_i1:563-910(+)